jgi:hypothetical protein
MRSVPENSDEFWMNDDGCMHNSDAACTRGLRIFSTDFPVATSARRALAMRSRVSWASEASICELRKSECSYEAERLAEYDDNAMMITDTVLFWRD